MTSCKGFMETPLVIWVQTFSPVNVVSYQDLADGAFLNDVMREIDPKANISTVIRKVEEYKDRLQNWDILLKNIKTYYKEVLQQLLVMRMPNAINVCKDPLSDKASEDIQKVLLMILGCAVQCERKEVFINAIRDLDIPVQQAIVEHIQEITDDEKNVFSVMVPEQGQLPQVAQVIFNHLQEVVSERDGYLQEVQELSQNLDELYQLQQQTEMAQKRPPTPPSNSPEKHHLAVELAEIKAKLRKLRTEYEEKADLVAELQEENEEHKQMLTRLRNENLDLVQEARAARTYRDEVDILKDKANRVDKYEAEITKYREKLNELEFFKSRVEELREDNAILVETKNMLEDQLSSAQKRVETVVDLENDLIKYKQLLDEVNQSRDKDRERIEQLVEENAQLEFEKKSSFNESATLEEELMRTRTQLNSGLSNPLSEQINETANAKILRLELDNQRLSKRLKEIENKEMVENTSRVFELEKENHRLSKKVEKLQESVSKETQGQIESEQVTQELHRERGKLNEMITTIRESSDRQVRELEQENEQLTKQVNILRERNEKTHDLKMKETEKENKRLHDTVKTLTAQVSKLDYNFRSLQKAHENLKDNFERSRQLEEENQRLEKENDDLHKRVTTLQLTCDKFEKLEQEVSDLEVEKHKLSKQVDSLKAQVLKMEALEEGNINLTVENQALKRSLENLKNSSTKLGDLEHELSELQRENDHLRKSVESLRSSHSKYEQLEIDLLDLDTDNQKLQRNVEARNRRIQDLEQDLQDAESKYDALEKSLDTMKLSLHKLEDLEKENKSLEYENAGYHKEKSQIEKENKRIRQSLEIKEATVDELTTKVSSLEKENKTVSKNLERSKGLSARVRELEKENTELVQSTSMDKKTLATLREELVNEKITTQTLSNELEKLTQELEKVGLNKETLVSAKENDSKYQALENMMQKAFRSSLDIKEEKIHALESRLEESKNRNLELQNELRNTKRSYEAFQQRREEEVLQASVDKERPSKRVERGLPNATKDILELKDHLITVERTNATLEAENKNLRQQASSLQERLNRMENQSTGFTSQLSHMQGQTSSLHTQLAKVQVENTTLQSQNSSLVSQNVSLQKSHAQLEADHDELVSTHEALKSNHGALVTDHDALQKLHDQLTAEYEALISEHGSLKANFKALKMDLKELQEQHAELQREKKLLSELKRSLEEDREALKSETKNTSSLQLDFMHVKEENIRIRSANDKMAKEYKDLAAEHKHMKTEYNQLQLKHTKLQGDFADCRDQLNSLDVEISKMVSRCEALSQLNTKLEEENRTLMMQLQALLTQNQELLTQSLESKDHFHEEERAYMEKLAELRRQKEKLEEKIMEQYKRYDPIKKKNRSFGANLVRKARGFISRANRSRERNRTVALGSGESTYMRESPENSSLGSGSMDTYGETTDLSGFARIKKNRQRRNSVDDLLESPVLSKQKKKMAQSTTALNTAGSDSLGIRSNFSLRGAQSSDNLLGGSDLGQNRRSDNDSISSGGSNSRTHEWPARPYYLVWEDDYDFYYDYRDRKQNLLESTSSAPGYSSGGRLNSLSSDDNTSRRGIGVGEGRVPGISPRPSPRDEDGNGSDDDILTLEQFLQESNRSPAARRKLLRAKKIDPDVLHTEDLETTTIPPPNFLTPRAPTVDSDSMEERSMKSAKSESAIAHLSRQGSGSSFTNDTSHFTSTPKVPHSPSPLSNRGYGERQQPQGEARGRSISDLSSSLPWSGQFGGQPPNRRADNGIAKHGSESDAEYQRLNDVAQYRNNRTAQLPSPSMNRGYGQLAQSLPYTQSNSKQSNSQRPPQGDPLYRSLPRKPTLPPPPPPNSQWENGLTKKPSLPPTPSNSSKYSDYMPMDGAQRALQNDAVDAATRRLYDDPYSRSNGSMQGTSDSQYQPSNVRTLVQSFQQSVKPEPPLPPPRKPRSSFGAPPGSPHPTMGGAGSAFSVPRSQPSVPSYTTININANSLYGNLGGGHASNGPSNLNNNASSDKMDSVGRPGSTPPRPAPQGRDGQNKANSVWYEYGCV